ncbi:hypothetical protein RJT34_24087 [Clitoria ternatea]|uniref:Uncharacterized protein n=1 Tax=Clitoria ternatea TaxID=43366 RepID=A0AAN9FME9_CLITE
MKLFIRGNSQITFLVSIHNVLTRDLAKRGSAYGVSVQEASDCAWERHRQEAPSPEWWSRRQESPGDRETFSREEPRRESILCRHSIDMQPRSLSSLPIEATLTLLSMQ